MPKMPNLLKIKMPKSRLKRMPKIKRSNLNLIQKMPKMIKSIEGSESVIEWSVIATRSSESAIGPQKVP